MAANSNAFYVINETDEKWTSAPAIVTSGAVGTIAPGTPTKGADATAASWTGAVVPMVDGDGTTSQRFTGIAKNTSTDTASANGVVTTWLPLPGIVYAGKAKTASLANTVALVQGLFGKRVVFDLTSSVWSIDTAAADAAANMVVIIDGDPNTSLLHWVYKDTGTMVGQIA
jgi:hypothetical protein